MTLFELLNLLRRKLAAKPSTHGAKMSKVTLPE